MGCYGMLEALKRSNWLGTAFAATALAASVGVARRWWWARYLVFLLAVLFLVQWGYFVWVAAARGYFHDAAINIAVLSLLPGTASVLLGAYCCYVVGFQTRPEHG